MLPFLARPLGPKRARSQAKVARVSGKDQLVSRSSEIGFTPEILMLASDSAEPFQAS